MRTFADLGMLLLPDKAGAAFYKTGARIARGYVMTELKGTARDILNSLYVFPELRKVVVEAKILRKIMIHTGGDILVNGRLYDITSKSLGAGTYQLKLKRTNP